MLRIKEVAEMYMKLRAAIETLAALIILMKTFPLDKDTILPAIADLVKLNLRDIETWVLATKFIILLKPR